VGSLPLDTATVAALKRHAEEIRSLAGRVKKDIVEIGHHLTKAEELAGHGHCLRWLDQEFAWSEQTARNYMRVFEMSLIHGGVVDLDLPMRSLYLLASPSTPEPVRQEILGQAARGEPVSHAQIKTAVKKVKPKKVPLNHEPISELPTRDQLVDQIIDLFKQLDRHAQARCARMVQNIYQGRA
jgi:hypothetical protein